MAALVGFGLALAIPAAASAATYCVHQGGSCLPGEVNEGSNLQTALTDANGTGVADQVKVGAGVYVGPFTYAGSGGAVQITGVGASTVLHAGAANGITVLDVSNTASRVENLHIDVPQGNTTNSNIGLHLIGGIADGVSVQIPGSPTGSVFGVNLTGGTFRNGSVLGPMPAMGPLFAITGITGDGTLLIENSTLHVDEAFDIFGGGTVRRVDMQGRVGLSLQAETTGGANGNYLIENSLWRSQPGSAGDFVSGVNSACGGSANIHTTARNLTLVDNVATGHPVSSICNAAGRSATLDLTSSVIRGGDVSINASTTSGATASTVKVGYSDYNPATVATNGNSVINAGVGNVNLAPGFVGPTDFHLASESPLIDIGDPVGLATGESPVDLGGGARILNGTGACSGARRDIGAYEAAAVPALASCTPVPATSTSFPAKRKCKKHKKKHKRSAEIAKKHKKKCKKHKKRH
jgi:hypothetical protein